MIKEIIIHTATPLFTLAVFGCIVAFFFFDDRWTGIGLGLLALILWGVITIYVRPVTYSRWKRPTP